MNYLLDDLPHSIQVDDTIHKIDTSYRTSLSIIMAWEDPTLTNHDKVYLTLYNLFDEIPDNVEEAFNKAVIFLNCGETDNSSKEQDTKSNKRLYSFNKDSKYIYTAVDKALDGKLSNNEPIHWWTFCMAFMEISEKSFFARMIHLRQQKQKGKLSKEERLFWRENREILELEVPQEKIATEQEIRNMEEFEEKLRRAMEKNKNPNL
jgi:hypothetical protein